MSVFAKIVSNISNTTQELYHKGKVYFGSFLVRKGQFNLRTKFDYLQKGYGENPYFFMVVDKIATVVSQLDYLFVDNSGKSKPDSEEAKIWNKPNEEQWSNEFLYSIIADLMTTGEAFIEGIKLPGYGDKYQEFEVLPSGYTDVIRDDSTGKIIEYHTVNKAGKDRIIKGNLEDILYLKTVNILTPNLGGLSRASVLSAIIHSSNSINDSEASIFQNRGISEILTDDSDNPLTPTQAKELQKEFQKNTSGTGNSGRIHVTGAKLRNVKLGMSPSDLKLLDNSVAKLRVMSSSYGLDSSLFSDFQNKTYNNIKEAKIAAYVQVYIPLALNYIVRTFNSWWLADNWKSNLRIELNEDSIDELKAANKELTETDKIRAQTIDIIVKMPISKQGKKAILIKDLDMSDDEAEKILSAEGDVNKKRDVLSAISPLIASKIIDKLSDIEIKDLLN